MPVSKRLLGVAYLVGTGLVLTVLLVGRLVLAGGLGFDAALATASGLAVSVSLVYVGVWLARSGFGEERVWNMCEWGGFGIAVLTLVSVLGLLGRTAGPIQTWRADLLVSNVAVGGVGGVLAAGVRELRVEHDVARDLTQRNAVLSRVLRHNLRNDMNLVVGYADEVERDAGPHEAIDRIRTKAHEVIDLSEKVRRIEEGTRRRAARKPVDLADVVEQRIEFARRSHPGATIETDLAGGAWVHADGFLERVIDNLLENAIEYGGDRPRVHVSVREKPVPDDDRIELRVADHGPGIPEGELEVLFEGRETPLRHSSGVGLWLVKWFVDDYDGELSFEENDPTGTVVVVELPQIAFDGHEWAEG